MLRRRKEDVESQLPGRVDKTFFVPMTDAQTSFYDDYERLVGRWRPLPGGGRCARRNSRSSGATSPA